MTKELIIKLYPTNWPGGIKEATGYLRLLKRLSADVICLCNVNLGFIRHDDGFNTIKYLGLDPQVGTTDQLQTFVNLAHLFGFKVIMDLNLNHSSIYSNLFKNHPEYYYWSHIKGKKWSWDKSEKANYFHYLNDASAADFAWYDISTNTLNQELIKTFHKITSRWKRVGLDGFNLKNVELLNKTRVAKDKVYLSNYDKSIEIIKSLFKNNEYLLIECLEKGKKRYQKTRAKLVIKEYSSLDNLKKKYGIEENIGKKEEIELLFGNYKNQILFKPNRVVLQQFQEIGAPSYSPRINIKEEYDTGEEDKNSILHHTKIKVWEWKNSI